MEYTVTENQTIIDLAVQLYGNAGAVGHLLGLNPQLTGRDPAWELSGLLPPGTVVYYDDEGADKRVLNELGGKLVINE
jgi:hypothetical protein